MVVEKSGRDRVLVVRSGRLGVETRYAKLIVLYEVYIVIIREMWR